MRTRGLQFLRWAAVILFGGYGLRLLTWDMFYAHRQPNGYWGESIFITLFLTVFSAPFLWVAYICFREKYHRLVTVFAAIGAVVICGMLISLPERLGIQDFFFHEVLDHPWLIIIDLPLSLICLFWPFWAAAWFFRFCHRLATRYLHDATSKARNA